MLLLFSHSVMSDNLQPHGLQHIRLPCPSLSLRVRSNPYPVMPSNHLILCRPFLLLASNFPSIMIFSNESVLHIRWPKYWTSASVSVLPVNIEGWVPLGWSGWISLQSKELSRVFSNTTVKSINSSALTFLYSPTLTSIQDYWKNHSFD